MMEIDRRTIASCERRLRQDFRTDLSPPSQTQAFDGRVIIDAQFLQRRSDSLIRRRYAPRAMVGPRKATGGPCASAASQAVRAPFPYEPCTASRIVASLAVCPSARLASPSQ